MIFGKKLDGGSAPTSLVYGAAGKSLCLFLCLAAAAVSASGQDSGDLSSKSLEELMNITVTSASKKEQKLFKTAAAIYVITQEDIRRSGMTTVPDLLRMVPGLDVARIDGTKWAITARGFNNRFATKLLVMIDGRSVYSPETSGVYWEALDVPLEDIDRIEIIRGPGGTLWGANAVNGVINIITKPARDTQGGLVAAGGGSEYRVSGLFQYGGQVGDDAYYRAFANYLNSSGLIGVTGQEANDGQDLGHAGVRMDWQPSERDSLTLIGDIFNLKLHENTTNVSPVSPLASHGNTPGIFDGGDVMERWTHIISDRSDVTLQAYWNRSVRDVNDFGERLDTYDLDFQHHFQWGSRQDMIWGFGYRFLDEQTDSSLGNPVQLNPRSDNESLVSGFFQDEFSVSRDRLALIAGAKLEYNTFSGFDYEPDIRLLWTPNKQHTIWAAASRAVRTPSFVGNNVLVNLAAFPGANGVPDILSLIGQKSIKSEDLLAYEAGYRVQPFARLSLDIAGFYNIYHHLNSLDSAQPFFAEDPAPHVVIPFLFQSLLRGRTGGVEVSSELKVTNAWKLSASYSFLHMNLVNEFPGQVLMVDSAGNSPQSQFQVRSYLNLPHNIEFDAAAYYVSALTAQSTPSYTRLDLRVGWRPAEHFEFSLAGENLLDSIHAEYQSLDTAVIPTRVRRSISGKLTWRP